MKAIILAAGVGSRLRPITDQKPKTLVTVNNKAMLGYIIDALTANSVNEIVMCTGYKSPLVREYCLRNYPEQQFVFVENEDYDTTNNLYSLYLAREHMSEDFLLMNADLVFDKTVITELITWQTSAFCVDVGNYLDESMKVIIDEHNNITAIAKTISRENSSGVSIDVYAFRGADCQVVQTNVMAAIERDQRVNDWTEALLNDLLLDGDLSVQAVNIAGKSWYEIDNFEDLSKAEKLFNQYIPSLSMRKIFIFDVDGTIALGESLFPETKDIISALVDGGKKIYILTNNSSRTSAAYRDKLCAAGLASDYFEVLSAVDVSINFLHSHNYSRIYWAATDMVDAHMRTQGFMYDEVNPQAILLTYDTSIDYKKITTLVRLLNKGTPYFATHTDMVCPVEAGYSIPDIGCIIQLLESTTGLRPQKTFGKPNREMLDMIARKENAAYKDIVIFGDRLYTDIALASGTEALCALVLTGETSRAMYEQSQIKADIILDSIADLELS